MRNDIHTFRSLGSLPEFRGSRVYKHLTPDGVKSAAHASSIIGFLPAINIRFLRNQRPRLSRLQRRQQLFVNSAKGPV